MLDSSVTGWPDGIQFSMAPFGYTVHASKKEHTEGSVTYQCDECDFRVSVDPRDMTIHTVSSLMRTHVDQAH